MLLLLRNLSDINPDFTIRYRERLESLATLSHLIEKYISLEIIESNLTSSLVQYGTHGCSCDNQMISLLLYLIIGLTRLRHNNKTLLITERLLRSSLYADNSITYYL